jgi:hypothetical protein
MKQSLHSLWRKCLFLGTLLLTLNFTSFAQLSSGTYYEAGITIGPMGYLGDLGGNFGKGTTFIKDYNIPNTQLSYGAFIAAHPSEWLGIRLALNLGNVSGDDAKTTGKDGEEETRRNRNLNFRSHISEAFLAAEIYPTVFFESDPTDIRGRLRPYGLIGVGVYHFNPQGLYTDSATGAQSWVNLRPLHTEGEGFAEYPNRKEYALTQLNIPMGVGIKYYLNESVNFSFEIVHRKLFTDYLDDVSTTFVDPSLFYKYLSPADAKMAVEMSNKSPLRFTPNSGYTTGDKRGDPSQNDSYFTTTFKIAIRLGSGSDREWRNSTRCPVLRF